jgi:hypothetical protein
MNINKLVLAIVILFLHTINADAKISKQQMLAVNKEWQLRKQHPTNFEVKINANSYDYLIAQHLLNVANSIASNARTNALPIYVKNKKLALLKSLVNYAQAGTFPINDYLPYQNPVFIDRIGTHCAVGYLLQQSGHDDIAQEINATQQFAYIRAIKNHRLDTWAKDFGFTKQELAWIQPGYPSDLEVSSIDSGVNGSVNTVYKIDTNTYILGGNFNKLHASNENSSNIALLTFDNNSWHLGAIPNGPNGPVYSITKYNNYIIMGGKFSEANGVQAQNIVAYDPISSSTPFLSIGNLADTVKCLITFKGKLFAGGTFTNLLSSYNGVVWQDANNSALNGHSINALKEHDDNLYVGGNFIIDNFTNIAKINATGQINNCDVSTTPVNCFEVLNQTLYAGCTYEHESNKCWLATYSAQGLWTKYGNATSTNPLYLQGKEIKHLVSDGTKLYCSGNFTSYGGSIMFHSKGTCTLELDSAGKMQDHSFIGVNGPINYGLVAHNNFIGVGSFLINDPWQIQNVKVLNNIVHHNLSPTAISISQRPNSFYVAPNPASDVLRIFNLPIGTRYSIYDAFGKSISTGKYQSAINIKTYAQGTYYLHALGTQQKFVVQ